MEGSPEWICRFEHIHVNQEERFHIKSGEIKIIMNGKEITGRSGDTLVVPKGERHIARNNKTAVLTCLVEYKPGLDNYTFFQCFAGITIDKKLNKSGDVNIPKMCYFIKKMNAQCVTLLTNQPPALANLIFNFFFIIGALHGWKKLYTKYTGKK